MKKISFVVCLILAMSAIFSLTACTVKENGVTIKYATVSLSYENEKGDAKSEDVVIKLYTNYAPKTIERFIELANEGFYNDTVVNNVETSWISLGGYKLNGEALEEVKSGKELLNGEFATNGFAGNKLTVTNGSVIMYRNTTTVNDSNYNTADCRFAICTSSAAPFTAADYCVIGKVENEDDLKVLTEISALRDRESDNDESEYNRYYVGGIDEIAKSFLNENGTLTDFADEKGIELEDVQKVTEGGELYHGAGYIDEESYSEFYEVAKKFITAINGSSFEYFYCVPWNTVKITGVKISNRI